MITEEKAILIKGSLYGGIIVFVWGAISWMVLPFHNWTLKKFSNEDAVASIIEANTPQKGVYMLPNFSQFSKDIPQAEKARRMHHGLQRMEEGPVVIAAIEPNGITPMAPSFFIISMLIQMFGAFLATFLLLHAKAMSYMKKVYFVTLLGIFAATVGHLPNWNWFHFALDYTLINMLDLTVGWFLAGLVIAKVVK